MLNMKIAIYIISTILIIAGIVLLCFSHEGFRYHAHETFIALGPLQLGSDVDATVPFSPIYGGICLAIGTVLFIIGLIKR